MLKTALATLALATISLTILALPAAAETARDGKADTQFLGVDLDTAEPMTTAATRGFTASTAQSGCSILAPAISSCGAPGAAAAASISEEAGMHFAGKLFAAVLLAGAAAGCKTVATTEPNRDFLGTGLASDGACVHRTVSALHDPGYEPQSPVMARR